MENSTQSPLLTSAQLADAEHFADFYRTHANRVLVYFMRRVYDGEAALDLTAETFAAAFLRRRRFRGSTEAEAAGWLYGIAKRKLALYIRRGKAEARAMRKLGIERPALDDENLGRIEELAELASLRQALAAELEALPADQREALRLRVVDELPYPAVADRLAITEVAARARVSRALRKLHAALAPLAEPPAATTGEEMVQ